MTEVAGEVNAADAERLAAIEDLLSFVDVLLPSKVPFVEPLDEVFACAAIRRLADLLRAETILAVSGSGATSRVIGRAAIESWLWACYLMLEPDASTDRLLAESIGHQRRLASGVKNLWDAFEEIRAAAITEPVVPSSQSSAWPKISEIAPLVASARVERGLDGMRTRGMYEERYRYDSAYDVHPSFELLKRYFQVDDEREVATVFREAQLDPGDEGRGVGGAFDTALMLLDALAVYRLTRDLEFPSAVERRLVEIVQLA